MKLVEHQKDFTFTCDEDISLAESSYFQKMWTPYNLYFKAYSYYPPLFVLIFEIAVLDFKTFWMISMKKISFNRHSNFDAEIPKIIHFIPISSWRYLLFWFQWNCWMVQKYIFQRATYE